MTVARSGPAPQRWARWSDAVLAWRDRRLASPAFQRWAAAFPLTRPLARRKARALFDLVAGFVYSQVLLACVRLRLFELHAEGPQPLAQIATRIGLRDDAALRLLSAAVSLRLVERRRGGRYGLGDLGAPMVGNAAVAAMVEHHAALYADLADPVALLRAPSGAGRDGELARYWTYLDAPAASTASVQRMATYTALMSASQPLVADDILDAYPLARHQCLLDVGGGDGTFLRAVARRAPHLRLMLFDLPSVADEACRRLESAGVAQRVTVHAGSFLRDPLPPGADVATLVRVVHDHDDGAALVLLRSVRRALPPGGTLLLAEPMSGTPGAEAMGDAYFGFYLLAMGRGRPRSAAELTRMLGAAGFVDVRLVPTRMPLQTQLLVATASRVNPVASDVNYS
jgi:demethylspheroidene O-methyltransferase